MKNIEAEKDVKMFGKWLNILELVYIGSTSCVYRLQGNIYTRG